MTATLPTRQPTTFAPPAPADGFRLMCPRDADCGR